MRCGRRKEASSEALGSSRLWGEGLVVRSGAAERGCEWQRGAEGTRPGGEWMEAKQAFGEELKAGGGGTQVIGAVTKIGRWLGNRGHCGCAWKCLPWQRGGDPVTDSDGKGRW